MIIVGVGGSGFGLYSFGFGGRPSYALPIMIIGLVVLAGGVVFFILGERQEKAEKKDRLVSRAARRTPSVYEEVKEVRSQSEIHALKKVAYEKTRIKAIYVPQISGEHRCMISKLSITSADEILQCPSCKSYFLLEYLVEWVEKNVNCPVCKYHLR
jgi:hypothetical protein